MSKVSVKVKTKSSFDCLTNKTTFMEPIFLKQNEGFGYNETMLPDYDGFIILKPGFLEYCEDVRKDLRRRDFIIVESLEKTLTKEEAETIYSVHKDKAFFKELIDYMTSGPCIGMILKSPFSDRESSTDALKLLKDKYRRRYSTDIMHNVLHSSDSYQNAMHEAETFFK